MLQHGLVLVGIHPKEARIVVQRCPFHVAVGSGYALLP
jgi:hypothetical protein